MRGGIAYEAGGAEAKSILDFSLSPDSFHLGARLLTESLKSISARTACYHLYNDTDQFADYKQCFFDAGFYIAQEKLSYQFTGRALHGADGRIAFRPYADVGEKEFLETISLVTQQTLDRIDSDSVAKNGSSEAAKIHVEELKEIDFQPDIWMIAYADKKRIGLVVPANLGDHYGAINYIGVVPTERGKGYADHLLRKGTQLLLDQGVTTVLADIDVLNFPMRDALERVGYHFANDEVVLEKRCKPGG